MAIKWRRVCLLRDNFTPGNQGNRAGRPRAPAPAFCWTGFGQRGAGLESWWGTVPARLSLCSQAPGSNLMGDNFEPGAFIVVIVSACPGVTRNPKKPQESFRHQVSGSISAGGASGQRPHLVAVGTPGQ